MDNNLAGETHRPGRIEVVCGSMFSGKTEELIRRMKRAKFAKQKVEIFKPAIDTRYSDIDVVSHDQHSIPSAICVRCGALAYVSHRLVANDKRVLLGEQAEYEPLCRECYMKAVQGETK